MRTPRPCDKLIADTPHRYGPANRRKQPECDRGRRRHDRRVTDDSQPRDPDPGHRQTPRPESLYRLVARDLGDLLSEHHRPDWIALAYPAAIGAGPGALIGASLADDTRTRLLLAAAGLFAGASAAATALIAVMALILAVEHTMDRSQRRRGPGRTRRHQLRHRTRRLREKTRTDRRTGRIPLENLDEAAAELSRTVEDHEHPHAGLRERHLRAKALRARHRAENTVERSWAGALDEAVETLTGQARSRRLLHGDETPLELDGSETAWYLLRTPNTTAVRRLLVEHLPQRDGSGTDAPPFAPLFAPGVVYTPRWVHELALAGELHARSRRPWPWDHDTGGRRTWHCAIGEECVDTDGADHETIAKLYEPHGNGPLSSLSETVAIAKRI